jgi:hypothetical protein
MTSPLDQINIIRAAMAGERSRERGKGTLISFSPSSLDGTATLDPDPTPMPVKITGSARCLPGDRVILFLIDRVWWVLGVEPRREFTTQFFTGVFANPDDTTTSATYVDMGTGPHGTLVKLYTDTTVLVSVGYALFVLTTTARAQFGVNINGVDYDVKKFAFNIVSMHSALQGTAVITGLPAGTYPVTLRWKRPNTGFGAGVLHANDDDQWTLEMTEQTS